MNAVFKKGGTEITEKLGFSVANLSHSEEVGGSGSGSKAMAQNMGAGVMGGYMQNPQYAQQPQQAPQAQQQPPQAPQQGGWTCECGAVNSGKFCTECGKPKPEAPKKRFCTNCGAELNPNAKFCPECGSKQ